MEGNEKWQREVRGTEVCLVRGQILPGHDVPGAFYSEKLPGLSGAGRIVVLNTNLYYSNNERTADMTDPSQQFQWLEDVLTNASRAGEMVRLLPPPPSFLRHFLNKSSRQHNLTHLLKMPTSQRVLHQPGAWSQEGASSILTTACEAGTPGPIADVRLLRGTDNFKSHDRWWS